MMGGKERREAALFSGRVVGLSLTGLIKWQDALWQQEHYLPLKRPGKAPLIGFPDSLFYRTSSAEPWFKELSGKLALSPLVPPTAAFDQPCDMKLTEKTSLTVETTHFLCLCEAQTMYELSPDFCWSGQQACLRGFCFCFPSNFAGAALGSLSNLVCCCCCCCSLQDQRTPETSYEKSSALISTRWISVVHSIILITSKCC